MARILVLGARVPFTRGGQEALVDSLVRELKARGHQADELSLPYEPFPKEGILAQAALWRAYDLTKVAGHEVDLVICTKFPTFYARHPKKVVWLVHQRRELYDLYGSRFSDFGDSLRDEAERQLTTDLDTEVLREARVLAGISGNVVDRLAQFNGLKGEVLYPPLPLGDRYHFSVLEPSGPDGGAAPFVLSVGRICSIKRIEMIVKAMPLVDPAVTLKIAGVCDEPGYQEYLNNEIAKHHLESRVQFLGRVADEELLNLYRQALAVYYAPHDEDYGYVTLEAFASGRPVIAARDSGGVLEFVRSGQNGLVVDPSEVSVAEAVNQLRHDSALANSLGRQGRELVERLGLIERSGWDRVVQVLTSPIVPEVEREFQLDSQEIVVASGARD